jgi:hypothetical protein
MQSLNTSEFGFVWVVFVVLALIIGGRLILALQAMRQSDHAHPDVIALLGRAANEMAAQPASQEAEEVVYLLDVLGRRVDGDTYRQVLEAVQGDVAVRLQAMRA